MYKSNACSVLFVYLQNATPGLQVFKSPVAYAEVDSDYHLCPLPKYTLQPVEPSQHKSTQKEFLDREVSV